MKELTMPELGRMIYERVEDSARITIRRAINDRIHAIDDLLRIENAERYLRVTDLEYQRSLLTNLRESM